MSETGVQARVEAIFTGPEEGGPITEVESIKALAGQGLEGDRYFLGRVAGQETDDPADQITLFELEAIELTNAETDLDVQPVEMRRNIMTSGVTLLDQIGKHLKIGDAVVEPMEDNPPCSWLVELVGKPLLKPMIERGGVRGRVVVSGTIRAGDQIEVLEVNAQTETG
ncbi:MAG: MOSC domain-containing protein [Actinomycetota bacterium]